MTHPYEGLPAHQFHRSAIAGRHPAFFDPVVTTKFTVATEEPIATMGSCFAQNLSKWLITNGHNFLATEPSDENGGGKFSANFGNVYTVAQALQLYRFAHSQDVPDGSGWINSQGKLVDPLRPSATANGFESREALLQAREQHYRAVREMFNQASSLVFTLGLTEAWRRKSDGAVLPTAPGIIAGSFGEGEYEFVNFTFERVCKDLAEFLDSIIATNAGIKIILTVSPVPLAATFERRHVAVSTMASKAILRAAIDALLPKWNNVDYFPSFEIFYTPGIGGRYFEANCRHVNRAGVLHAMRCFEQHFLHKSTSRVIRTKAQSLPVAASNFWHSHHNVVCDEDDIHPMAIGSGQGMP